jgi:hypothetical protein
VRALQAMEAFSVEELFVLGQGAEKDSRGNIAQMAGGKDLCESLRALFTGSPVRVPQ